MVDPLGRHGRGIKLWLNFCNNSLKIKVISVKYCELLDEDSLYDQQNSTKFRFSRFRNLDPYQEMLTGSGSSLKNRIPDVWDPDPVFLQGRIRVRSAQESTPVSHQL